MTTELYKKYRPRSFKMVIGQEPAVNVLHSMVKRKRVPHSLLFTGPSGCGKTTLARILRSKLDCGEVDFSEINSASFNGINTIREIQNRMHLSPISGPCRIWLIDECHKMSNDAQNAFLKILEDTPSHVYFMLATTDPGKLIATVKTRCTEVKVQEVTAPKMLSLLQFVCGKEETEVAEEVLEKIVEHSLGSARKALVLLDQVMGIDDQEEQMNCIESANEKEQAIKLARELIKPGANWKSVAALLKEIDEDPEGLRYMILAYATSVMLGAGKLTPRAALIVECFSDNFYSSKRAGLVAACYDVVRGK